MSVLKDVLKPGDNKISSYFPSRASTIKEGSFDWEVAKAVVVRNLYRKQLNTNLIKKFGSEGGEGAAIEYFKKVCKKDFELRIDDEALWPYLEDMYFSEGAVYDIAPEALLFKLASIPKSSNKNNLANMFASLMHGMSVKGAGTKEGAGNFLEDQIVNTLRSDEVLTGFTPTKGDVRTALLSHGVKEMPYLPFLTEVFGRDLEFLANRPNYLLEQLESLLRLYAYLYTAQLALNITTLNREPEQKPLFFIMESESASRERTDLVTHGHQSVAAVLKYIFPYLSVSESLQDIKKSGDEHRLPLWKFAQNLKSDESDRLKEYAEAFAKDRHGVEGFVFSHEENDDPRYWLGVLLEESLKQFSKGKTRAAAQSKFIKNTELGLFSDFVKARGRVGKVLVMNQDYITLLTNLAIGERDKLRFHELMEKFNARGVFFDKQSQKCLIKFYERVGNVERMSDSGDAVYVRKTL